MSEGQFTKLFKYMERRFDDHDARFDYLEQKFDKLQTTMDSITGDYTVLVDENKASAYNAQQLSDRVDNHETRIANLELNKKVV